MSAIRVVRAASSLLLWICGLSIVAQPLPAASSLGSTQAVLAPGASIDAGQWRVKPLRARISSAHPRGLIGSRLQRFLIVEVELTNLMDRSSRDFTAVVQIDPALGEPDFLLARDSAQPDRLHPAMPETMILYWNWPENTPAPDTLRLAIQGKTFKKADNLTGAPGWFNPKIIATASLPVSEQP